jgi:hypothetical protein
VDKTRAAPTPPKNPKHSNPQKQIEDTEQNEKMKKKKKRKKNTQRTGTNTCWTLTTPKRLTAKTACQAGRPSHDVPIGAS